MYRWGENDLRNATDLADLPRWGRLRASWLAPPPTRELRELCGHRARLVARRRNASAGPRLARCAASWSL